MCSGMNGERAYGDFGLGLAHNLGEGWVDMMLLRASLMVI